MSHHKLPQSEIDQFQRHPFETNFGWMQPGKGNLKLPERFFEWGSKRLTTPLMIACVIILFLMTTPLGGQLALFFRSGALGFGLGFGQARYGQQLMHPSIFVFATFIGSAASRFFVSETWYSLAGEDNAMFMPSGALTLIMLMLTACCMVARYATWYQEV